MKGLTLEQKLMVKHNCLQVAKELVIRGPMAGSTAPSDMVRELIDAAKTLEEYFEEE